MVFLEQHTQYEIREMNPVRNLMKNGVIQIGQNNTKKRKVSNGVNEQRILEELLELLEANSVTIRQEQLGGSGGGLCTVKGEPIFFVDTQASSAQVAAICAEAVPKVADIERVYIKPEVRQFIEMYSGSKRSSEKWQGKR